MNEIKQALSKVAGLKVIDDATALSAYEQDDSGHRGQRPLAIVRPNNVPGIQALAELARQTDTQLLPVSSTLSHHRGDTLCANEKTLIVDMSDFDEVIRADRRNRVIMFEAGVDFGQLETAARSVGLRPMLPLAPRPGKSALSAYLEREPTIYPRFMWDTADPLLCLEVIFGSGELFRTGAAAGPGSIQEQWATGNCQKTPIGPGHSDLQRIVQGAQGSLGIVTWCTAKAEPASSKEHLYVLGSNSLDVLIELCYKLLRRELPDICFIVNRAALQAIRKDTTQTTAQAEWQLVFSLSAPALFGDEKLAYVQDEVHALCEHFLLADQLQNFAPREQALLDILTQPSHPANNAWWKQAGRSTTRELFFQTTLDCAAKFVPTAQAFSKGASDTGEMLTYIQPQLGGRHCHMEFAFPHDHRDADFDAQLNAGLLDLARQLQDQGAYFSRPYGPLAELNQASPAQQKMFANLRQIFDPHAVMAPAGVTRAAA